MNKIVEKYIHNEVKNYEDKSKIRNRTPELSKYKDIIVKKFLKDLLKKS